MRNLFSILLCLAAYYNAAAIVVDATTLRVATSSPPTRAVPVNEETGSEYGACTESDVDFFFGAYISGFDACKASYEWFKAEPTVKEGLELCECTLLIDQLQDETRFVPYCELLINGRYWSLAGFMRRVFQDCDPTTTAPPTTPPPPITTAPPTTPPPPITTPVTITDITPTPLPAVGASSSGGGGGSNSTMIAIICLLVVALLAVTAFAVGHFCKNCQQTPPAHAEDGSGQGTVGDYTSLRTEPSAYKAA